MQIHVLLATAMIGLSTSAAVAKCDQRAKMRVPAMQILKRRTRSSTSKASLMRKPPN